MRSLFAFVLLVAASFAQAHPLENTSWTSAKGHSRLTDQGVLTSLVYSFNGSNLLLTKICHFSESKHSRLYSDEDVSVTLTMSIQISDSRFTIPQTAEVENRVRTSGGGWRSCSLSYDEDDTVSYRIISNGEVLYLFNESKPVPWYLKRIH